MTEEAIAVPEKPVPDPEETDNSPRPEDGEQNLSQDPEVAYGEEATDE